MKPSIQKRNHIQVLGQGRETLVFAHGFGANQRVWRHQVEAFQGRYRIVLFDHVGFGGSDLAAYSPQRYRGLAQYAEDVLELCEELNLSACTWVGHSMSGMVGVLASLMEPDCFQRLVLLNGSPRYLNDPSADYFGGFEQPQVNQLYAAMESNFGAWAEGFARMMHDPSRPELMQEYQHSLSAMRPDLALALARIVFQSDHRLALPRVKVPTLVLQSPQDAAVPMGVSRYLAHHLQGARWVELDEAQAHHPHLSAHGAVNQKLEAFLSSGR